jgi:mannose-6-phosphate isomerase-like protein (cupin superfamily)
MTPENSDFDIRSTYVVLEENGNAIPVTVCDRFYEKLGQQFGDFKGKRLISHYTFEQDWDCWEMHPAGEEFVCLLSGKVDFVLERDGGKETMSLNTPGQFILLPRGIWHTARVHTSSSVLFITPGEGTQSRSLS